MDQKRIRQALSMVGAKHQVRDFPYAFQLIAWELMLTQTRLKKLEEKMDKQIKKVQQDIKHDEKKKGEKDVSKLLKMDKKYDAKLEKCGVKMGKKK